MATLEASTNNLTNIFAKRLIVAVKYVAGINPVILSTEVIGIRKREY